MKPFTKSTFGRNLYYYMPKEHKVPKKSKERRGTRTAKRQLMKNSLRHEVNNAI